MECSAAVEEGEERLSRQRAAKRRGRTPHFGDRGAGEEILSRQRARYCQRVTERRVTETATEREARLARRRVQDRARRASESLEQRDARLQQLRGSQQQRIASESTEEREAHLQQLRVSQQQRFASA